jgi:hydrogenase maturation protease
MTIGDEPVVVVGVGNSYRGDDAAGLLVANTLAGTLPDGVALHRCEQEPSRIMDAWGGAEAAIVVDAVSGDEPPGTLHLFDASTEPLPARAFRSSTHALGIGEIVELARAMGSLPRRVLVYGIEAGSFEPGHPVTPPVAAAVQAVAESIRADVLDLLQEED